MAEPEMKVRSIAITSDWPSFGLPATIVCDNGKELVTAQLLEQLAKNHADADLVSRTADGSRVGPALMPGHRK
ncbi:hypothetical protein [Ferrovibrio terrae]|uniref:hypothetical protein n=1 Tax=Ferrovibrio terrae TaxID=2594003 RepID=UPI003138458C